MALLGILQHALNIVPGQQRNDFLFRISSITPSYDWGGEVRLWKGTQGEHPSLLFNIYRNPQRAELIQNLSNTAHVIRSFRDPRPFSSNGVALTVLQILFFLFTTRSSAQSPWIWQSPYPQGSDINAVYFIDPDQGWTVGANGTLNRTTDGGTAWIQCRSGVIHHLYDISLSDGNIGTAVGGAGTILRTFDGGITWIKQVSGNSNQLRAVSFSSVNVGIVVGLNGTILRTTNGGAMWTSQSSGTTHHLFGISYIDAETAIVIGFNGVILRTTNAGATWDPQVSGTSSQLFHVDFSDINTGTIVSTNGTILRSTDGGTSWSTQASGTPNSLYGVSFAGNSTGVVTGFNGTILHTTDGGSAWIPAASGTTDAIYNARLTDINNGWAVGQFGTLLHTTDGGATWESQVKGTRRNLHGVSFADSMTGFAVGDSGTILKTADGGVTWMPDYFGTLSHLGDVRFYDSDHGIAVGQGGLILQTTDGGTFWDVKPSGITSDLYSLSYPTSDIAYTTGKDGYFLKTTDGGDSWDKKQFFGDATQNKVFMLDAVRGVTISTPVFWTRSSTGYDTLPDPYHIDNYPYRLVKDIVLTGGDTGIAVGATGYILRSTQAFSGPPSFAFSEVNSPTDKTLNAIDFSDPGTGIVVGDEGTVICTSDGGITWSTREFTGTSEKFNDVAYLDTNHIWIVGDRGTILRYSPFEESSINQFTVQDNWNIVSVPFGVTDYATSTLFPDAITSAFGFDNGYAPQDTLENGKGYWLKFPQAQTIVMDGTSLEAETVDVDAQWNMVGSLSTPLDIGTITSIPGGIVTSGFYQFDGAYQQSAIILPGKGYWVKCSQAGQLILSSEGNTEPTTRIRIEDRGELPPAPPEEHVSQERSVPLTYNLSQNTPNPFNPTTQISFTIPIRTNVTLRIYNLLGQAVSTLTDQIQSPGEHTFQWDANGVPSGIYFYRMVSGDYIRTMKMVVIK